MRSYFAVQRHTVHAGGWQDCVLWSRSHASDGPVQILTARAGESLARVVAEISVAGERLIPNGRTVEVSRLRRG